METLDVKCGELKRCHGCLIEKPVTEFHKDKNRLKGRSDKCKTCTSIYTKENYRANRDRIKAKSQYYRRKNLQTVKEKERKYHLRKNYQLTDCEYTTMLAAQDEKCLICGRHKSNFKYKLSVDHNHQTGKVRGLLCTRCNFKIAVLEDKTFVVEAKKYLYKYDGTVI